MLKKALCRLLLKVFLVAMIIRHVRGTKKRDPIFLGEITNETVSEGRNVRFACRVDNLGSHKVAWIHYDNSAILTVANHVITRNDRITVTHDKHQKTWYLHINEVRESDSGKYLCQINTASAMTKAGFLTVVVPPDIVDQESTGDVIVSEGSDVQLRCKSRGSPKPIVTWKREDNQNITLNKTTSVIEVTGEVLTLSKVSRMDMGAYLCIASNGHPPTVSKRILVSVDFPPMLWIPHQLVGSSIGSEVTMECFTEAHPTSLNFWKRGDNTMIYDSEKHKIVNEVGSPDYKIHMTLTVMDLKIEDFGTYHCVAKNPKGETDGSIKVYNSGPIPTTTILPATQAADTRDDNSVLPSDDKLKLKKGKKRKRPNSLAVSDVNDDYSNSEDNISNLRKGTVDVLKTFTGGYDSKGACCEIPKFLLHFCLLLTVILLSKC